MSNVEFQEEVRGRVRGEKVSFITKLLMKMGVKDEKQANKVMLGIVVFCVLATIITTQFGRPSSGASIDKSISPNAQQEFKNWASTGKEMSPDSRQELLDWVNTTHPSAEEIGPEGVRALMEMGIEIY